jgi:N-methylhydantoinase B
VLADLQSGRISPQCAAEIYGVVIGQNGTDLRATEQRRHSMRVARVGTLCDDPARFVQAEPILSLGGTLFLARDRRGFHVVSRAGFVLSTGSTRWRAGAVAVPMTLPGITLHEHLAMTGYCCPATGSLLSLDIHEKATMPPDDIVLDLDELLHAGAERLS